MKKNFVIVGIDKDGICLLTLASLMKRKTCWSGEITPGVRRKFNLEASAFDGCYFCLGNVYAYVTRYYAFETANEALAFIESQKASGIDGSRVVDSVPVIQKIMA